MVLKKDLQIDENTPIDVLLNHIKMLDSFQNNIIVFIIHITIASTEKKLSELAMFSTKLININRSNLVSKLSMFSIVGI